jgi:hypothetical protein
MSTTARVVAGLLSLLGLCTLTAQLPISVGWFVKDGGSVLGGVWRYFGYFTITSNSVCAIIMGLAALGVLRNTRWLSAVTSYMVVVCLVYWILLSAQNPLSGWPLLVDSVLHYVIPASVLVAWVCVLPKSDLRGSDPIRWLVYPIAYAIYVMIRGGFENWYPYFFLDVGALGYGRVALNVVGLAALFYGAGMILVVLARWTQPAKTLRAQ